MLEEVLEGADGLSSRSKVVVKLFGTLLQPPSVVHSLRDGQSSSRELGRRRSR